MAHYRIKRAEGDGSDQAERLSTDLYKGYETVAAWHADGNTFFLQRSEKQDPDRITTLVVPPSDKTS